MEEMMKYAYEKYNYLVEKLPDGRKNISEESINKLDLSEQEKDFLKKTFKFYGIKISAKPIEKKDRNVKVSHYDYGSIGGYDLNYLDKPVLATIEYEGENLVFEDYNKLDEFILNDFVPTHIFHKINRSFQINGEKKPYSSIRLSDLLTLKLSEKEVKHVVDLLNKEGIRVGGDSSEMCGEFENYDYVRTYATKKYSEPLTPQEEIKKFIKYYETKDPSLREELIIRNLRLVPYTCWPIAYRHNIDQQELEGYGYEGLIYAIDEFDPYLGVKFSSYAIPCIKGYIKKSVSEIKGISNPNNYFNFSKVRSIVEEQWGKQFDGDIEMFKDIWNLMLSQEMVQEKEFEKYYRAFMPKESLFDIIDNENYEKSIIDNKRVDEMVVDSMLSDSLKRSLDILSEKQKQTLISYFGLNGKNPMTLTEIAKKFQVSKAYVGQVFDKAIRRLKNPKLIRMQELKSFLDGELSNHQFQYQATMDNSKNATKIKKR